MSIEDQVSAAWVNPSEPNQRSVRLSYKFQRLRERIRGAITNGELAGKLPGERQLARKFKVNAKTLSKALTDLAAEGVLERNIGLGTFVRGGTASPCAKADKLLVLADAGAKSSPLLQLLSADFETIQVVTDPAALRPSLLQQHKLVLLLSTDMPEALLRDVIVRGMQVVRVESPADCYSAHTACIDRALSVAQCVRNLAVAGRRGVLVIEPDCADRNKADGDCDAELPDDSIGIGAIDDSFLAAARTAVLGTGDTLDVQGGTMTDLAHDLTHALDAVICDAADAENVLTRCRRLGLSVPGDIAVLAVGELSGPAVVPGFYVTTARLHAAVCHLLHDTPGHKPVTLFLAPQGVDVENLVPAMV